MTGCVDARELTDDVSLTLPKGRLNHDAVGWARQPLVDTAGIGRGWGRNKRWEYWNIATPTHILALTVSHIDYAAVHEVWVLDRATHATWHRSVTVLPARGVELPAQLESGRSRASARNIEIAIDELESDDGSPHGTRLRARIPGASFDVVASLPDGHERLAVVVPWDDKRFQYTVKDVARPAHGTLRLDGKQIEIPAGESWAVLDHGRGRWPYKARWNWGAGSGRSGGRVVGLQVGGRWTDGTGSTENSVVIDGRLHKIRAELTWEYDLSQPLQPWRVHGGGLDARFEPFYTKQSRTNLLVLSARTDQCFGHWSGTFTADDGVRLEFEGLLGWAEDVSNRW